MTVRVTGIPQTIAALERVKRSAEAASLPAVEAGGKIVVEAARRNAPLKTGRLRQSLILDERKVSPTGASVEVTSTVPYARHQEKGTRFHPAQPFLERSAEVMSPAVVNAIGRVYQLAIRRV